MARIWGLTSFLAAAIFLLGLMRWVWQDTIGPHAALVRCVPVQAIVVGRRVDVRGDRHPNSYPRVLFQYDFDGQTYRGELIRHPSYTRNNSEELDVGEVRFTGPDREKKANSYLNQFTTGRWVTAWVNPADPHEATLVRQNLEIGPFILGMVPGIFVPLIWMFFALAASTICGRPQGRWVAFGWAALVLASLGPVFWQYQLLSGSNHPTLFTRLQNFGLGLAGAILVASLLPAQFRRGMCCGLILCLTLVGGLGGIGGGILNKFSPITGRAVDPFEVLTMCLEYALISGIVAGLLFGLAARLGIIWIRPTYCEPPPRDITAIEDA